MKLSICVIARNEENFLPRLLEDIEAQTYPHVDTEVVLVDSSSSDSTKQVMDQFAKKSDFAVVQVLDNPKVTQAAGWNVAITHANGDVISRIDAHSSLPANFFTLVMRDIESGENIVGGKRPCIAESNTKWSRLLLAVENSLFGSSINSSRRSDEKKYVDTMFHASYRREVFDKTGLFNESLLRTEDNELHYRMREAGYKFAYDPDIVSYQYSRSGFGRMLKQKYGNGYWIGVTLKVCPKCISKYHLVPALFVFAIICSCILVLMGITWPAIVLWAAYALFAAGSAILAVVNRQTGIMAVLMPVLFLMLHVGYGVGTLLGLIFGKPVSLQAASERA